MPDLAMPAAQSAGTSPTARLDWWGNPVNKECTVNWCTGDCVLAGPGPLDHSKVLATGAGLVLTTATGDDAPVTRLHIGDDVTIVLTAEQVAAINAQLAEGGAR